VAKLQVYCSEDLGAFYLDVLKDRLYTTAPNSLARRSAQTALHTITHAMLRWMAPFLSFTAEEIWTLVGHTPSIFTETYLQLPAPQEVVLQKWTRVRELRGLVNKAIEDLRAAGQVGSSLQATVTLTVGPEDHALLQTLGADLKFVLIVSAVDLVLGQDVAVQVQPASAAKCGRCWHYQADVGTHTEHLDLCGRCIGNLHGQGEQRVVA
jgi:isoleucyl-tRNA synthetase